MKNLRKRFTALLLTGGLSLGIVGTAFATDTTMPFHDVKEFSWYQPFVKFVYDGKLFAGTSETTFSPDEEISRAQLVTVLASLQHKLQNRDVGSLTDIFPDVSSDEYYAKYVGWAQENGLVSGYPDGNFHPDDNITREQLAAIVNKYIQIRNDPLDTVQDIKPFSDTKNISDWAAQAVQNMQKYELMSGKIGNAFAPKESLTRAEAAVVITRLYESIRYPTENSANYQSIRCRSDNQDERVLTNGLAAKYGEDEHIRYQCISDYDTYMKIVNRAKQNASPLSSETQDFQLLDESFFQEHNVIAIELNHYGSPQYQTKLSNSSEMGTTGDAPDFWLDAEFFSRNASGATADSVSYIFFIEVSKHITKANIITETHRVEGFSTFMP